MMNKKYRIKFIVFVILGFSSLVSAQTEQTGLWHKIQIASPAKTQNEKTSSFMALSYLQGNTFAPQEKNVTIYNKDLAFNSYNLFTSGHEPEAMLMDMKGNVLHRWNYPIERIWPDVKVKNDYGSFWAHVHLLDNGELLAIYDRIGLVKLDKNSNLIWSYRNFCHHATDIDENGNIYVLTAAKRTIQETKSILDNSITILTPDGKFTRQISFYDLFKKSAYIKYKDYIDSFAQEEKTNTPNALEMWNKPGDIFHVNTLQIFDGKLESKSSVFKKGNVLVSMRSLGTIAIIDPEKETLIWKMGPSLWHFGQHQPVLLPDGHMLIFDNNCSEKKSCVIEFSPLTKEIFWQYKGTDKNPFFTLANGANQRLPNGNTLITESYSGRAFEVTSAGKIVWEFYNPNQTGANNEFIAVIPEMIRLNPDLSLKWLGR